MLSATIKFSGSIILQAQGDGNFRTLVAQSTHERKIRGLVRCKEDIRAGSLEEMFGQGRLVITIEPENSESYQGIVPLRGNNLAVALQTYFEQSEQLRTRILLFGQKTLPGGLLLARTAPLRHGPKSEMGSVWEMPSPNRETGKGSFLRRWELHLQTLWATPLFPMEEKNGPGPVF